ncbi:hypothetical protein EVAR_2976_1 [Eumeta japonica]|uniref:Uncharacterized protein n=1 Tax=Eumeta variegata TaxID=151549 RepID=A0A4C1SW88_EUMVA|nr:hypothetical protein EVAR_2976_1 [Eumeta japonica]
MKPVTCSGISLVLLRHPLTNEKSFIRIHLASGKLMPVRRARPPICKPRPAAPTRRRLSRTNGGLLIFICTRLNENKQPDRDSCGSLPRYKFEVKRDPR